MFGISTERVRSGYRILRFENGSWKNMPGAGHKIAVDSEGNAWVVTGRNSIFKWNPTTNRWVRVSGQASDIGIGPDGTVYILGVRSRKSGKEIYRYIAGTWKRVNGSAKKSRHFERRTSSYHHET